MKTFRNLMIGLTLATAPVLTVSAESGEQFEINDPMNRNTVTFKSTAPLEDIIGISNQLTGQLFFDPSKPEAGGSGEISIPVISLNTGIPMRDEHLASANWLNAEKNPNIIFKISELRDVKQIKESMGSSSFDVTAVGEFTLNGITKIVSAPTRITYLKESDMTKMRLPGNLLAARSNFDITLADYGITGPENMKLIGSKVGQSVAIELSLVASSVNPELASKLMSDKTEIVSLEAGNGKTKAACPACSAPDSKSAKHNHSHGGM